jgi:hypothetical protein
VFLKNVYSVFDFEKSRVGLGVLGDEQLVAGTESVSSTGMFELDSFYYSSDNC